VGQYDRPQWVFGATGAAAMFRRSFVEAVSLSGQFFDEEFFSYREDADLAWRGQLMGWKCLYEPSAVAWHVRRVTPERRESLPVEINWHSIKNRFLMRGKNASGWLCRRLFWPVAARDLMVVGYALFRDWRMLSAILYPLKNIAGIRAKRKIIQERRRVSDGDLLWWFNDSPRAIDVAADSSAQALSSANNIEGRL
jgi:GT2 family glycosyltransferase